MKQGFIVPVYRHGKTAGPLAEKLKTFGLPIIMVDDGNDLNTKVLLADCAAKIEGVVLINLEKNQGKGGAFTAGLEKAAEMGLTHVFQIDADGQHDFGRVAFFWEESAKNPGNVICGYPEFDKSAPIGRVRGRKISNFWAAVTTVSMAIKDALCGFRVYPVRESLRITKNPLLDKRMGFDAEILVRLYWRRVFPLFYPIKVIYPEDGISNFRAVRDNIRISQVFCRLSIGMLIRLPYLLILKILRKKKKA